MKARQWIRVAFSALVVGGISVTFNNCGKPAFTERDSSSNGVQASSLIVKTTDDRNYSLQSAQQLSASLSSVTGVDLTNSILNEYQSRKTLMTENQSVASVTSPMMIAITNLSSQYCGELLSKESKLAAANRRFFSSIDFNAGVSANGQSKIMAATFSMAKSFLGRELTGEERQIMTEGYTEFVGALPANGAASSNSTRNALLFGCSSVLSSFDFLTI